MVYRKISKKSAYELNQEQSGMSELWRILNKTGEQEIIQWILDNSKEPDEGNIKIWIERAKKLILNSMPDDHESLVMLKDEANSGDEEVLTIENDWYDWITKEEDYD